jgi:tRNA(Ile)-lysidine synthase
MMELIQKITQYIEKENLIGYGERIVLGVSGGADSVCLLRVLCQLQKEYALTLLVVHIEHGIRAEESLADAQFVKELCSAYDLEYRQYSYEVPLLAKQQSMTVEETGRRLRYETFARVAEEWNADRIAIAHNRNDNAETVLFQLARGSAMRGMRGIPVSRGKIIRPLLCVSREEIERYLNELGQDYRTDSTNADLSYTRNYVRHEILPRMEQVNAQAACHITQMAEHAARLQELLSDQAQIVLQQAYCEKGLLCEPLLACRPVVAGEALYEALSTACKGSRDISHTHVEALLGLLRAQVGSRLSLPKGVCAVRTYDAICFETVQMNEPAADEIQPPVTLIPKQSAQTVRYLGMEYTFWIEKSDSFDRSQFVGIDKKSYTKCFDYDKIKIMPVLRTRASGDRIVMDAAGREQKLKKYFINEKVPQTERGQIPLLADGSHILWIVGWRISEAYKVTEQTKQVLIVRAEAAGRFTKG